MSTVPSPNVSLGCPPNAEPKQPTAFSSPTTNSSGTMYLALRPLACPNDSLGYPSPGCTCGTCSPSQAAANGSQQHLARQQHLSRLRTGEKGARAFLTYEGALGARSKLRMHEKRASTFLPHRDASGAQSRSRMDEKRARALLTHEDAPGTHLTSCID